MSGLVGRALLARRVQTVAVFGLTMLATLAGAAAPWYLAWTHDTVAASDIAAAPLSQRVVTLSGSADYRAGDPSPLSVLRDQAARALPVPGGVVTVGGRIFTDVVATSVAARPTTGLYLDARDNLCDHVAIQGSCPDAVDEVLIGQSTATRLGVGTGDTLSFESVQLAQRVVLHVVGTYEARDVRDPYWTDTNLLGGPVGLLGTEVEPPAFVSEPALTAIGLKHIDVDYHLVLPRSAFHDSGAELAAQLQHTADTAGPKGFGLTTAARQLIDQIRLDQRLVRAGVQVATLELVLLSWFTLYLVVQQTSVVRRRDIGLLKLRGAPRGRLWLLTAGQSAIPMLAGVVAGGAGGAIVALAMARSTAVLHPAASTATIAASLLIAAVIGVGALLAAIVAEWGALRSSVLTLLRRVPGRRSRWRAPVGDLAVVVLASAGVYQGHAEAGRDGDPSTLALLAPGLIGLAAALLMARALPWLAAQSGAAALERGRAGAALGALAVARRPGTERVFAIVAVAVAVVSTNLFFGATARTAWQARAALELGAPRVLTVHAPNSTALLTAVRSADPSGRYAMAVARAGGEPTLAVDSARLAAVALLPAGYGLPAAPRLAALLRPVPPTTATLRDGILTLDAGGPDSTDPGPVAPESPPLPVTVQVRYADPAGGLHTVDFGPLQAGRHPYQQAVSGCTGGCSLLSIEPQTHRRQATVAIHALSQPAGGLALAGPDFADIVRWRSQPAPDSVGPVIGAHNGVLEIGVAAVSLPVGQHVDNRVYYAGTPVPVPVALAGRAPTEQRAGDARIRVLGSQDVPDQPVARSRVLPGLVGAGALMDLEYAQSSIGHDTESVSLEVWLTADAPSSIVDQLRRDGVEVLTDTTVADRVAQLAAQGPGLAWTFQLVASAVLLLLAGGALVVAAAVERPERAGELAALRDQGLSDRAMRFAGYATALLVVAGAVVTGLTAALLAQAAVTARLPVFTDRWTALPTVSGVSDLTLGSAAGLAVLVLVPAAVLGAARTVTSVRRRRARAAR